MKPFRENGRKEPSSESSHSGQSSLSSQVTCWEGNKRQEGFQRPQAQPGQPLPSNRAHFPGRTCQSGPRLQAGRGPQPSRTKGSSYSSSNSALPTQQGSNGGTVTMVTATASVTVAVHPSLPGVAYQGYMHEGFDTDGESDCFEVAKRTCGDKTNLSSCMKDSLELQDVEATQTEHQLSKTHGKSAARLCFLPQSELSKFAFYRQHISTESPNTIRSSIILIFSLIDVGMLHNFLSSVCLLQVGWGSRQPKIAKTPLTCPNVSLWFWAPRRPWSRMASPHVRTLYIDFT